MNNIDVHIDKNGPTPIYRQIEDIFRERIKAGLLRPYDLIPSENELSKILGVSPMTVRQAMGLLVKDGFAYRERGRGTFVAPPRLDHPLTRMVGFSEDMQARGLQPTNLILQFKNLPATAEVAESLQLSVGEPVLFIRRSRNLDGHPVGIHETYLRGVHFSREELEQTGSLYQLLQSRGIMIEGGQDVIEAISATEEISELLEVAPKEPLLQVTRVAFVNGGVPLELVYAFYRSDFYRYRISLKR
jgi:GntR family transcriptional regulator